MSKAMLDEIKAAEAQKSEPDAEEMGPDEDQAPGDDRDDDKGKEKKEKRKGEKGGKEKPSEVRDWKRNGKYNPPHQIFIFLMSCPKMSVGWTGWILKSPCLLTAMGWTRDLTGGKAMMSAYAYRFFRPFLLRPSLSRELSKAAEPYIKQEDEGKYRCKTCQKLFKAMSFVEKHIANKHEELVKQLEEVKPCRLYSPSHTKYRIAPVLQ